jgi:hypothetical protein
MNDHLRSIEPLFVRTSSFEVDDVTHASRWDGTGRYVNVVCGLAMVTHTIAFKCVLESQEVWEIFW